MNAHALLVLALVVHVLPEHLADVLGHSEAAWVYVAHGIEASALWLMIGVMIRSMPVLAVSTYGAMEGLQRAACRLALPMDRAPVLPVGRNLCDVATGLPASWFSLAAALMVACIAQEEAARHVASHATR